MEAISKKTDLSPFLLHTNTLFSFFLHLLSHLVSTHLKWTQLRLFLHNLYLHATFTHVVILRTLLKFFHFLIKRFSKFYLNSACFCLSRFSVTSRVVLLSKISNSISRCIFASTFCNSFNNNFTKHFSYKMEFH